MKGFIRKLAAGLSFGAGLAVMTGCLKYRECVDPCWPERYNGMARDSVRSMHFAQEEKGHILDQTIWNWQFEVDPKTGSATDHLNGAGIEHLKYISRRLPVPDCKLYLQNAQDVPYVDEMPPERLVEIRNDLNNRRINAIQRFLATQLTAGPISYHVAVHDFQPPGLPAAVITGTLTQPTPIQGALHPKLENNFQGVLPAAQGTGASGGTGR